MNQKFKNTCFSNGLTISIVAYLASFALLFYGAMFVT